VRRRTFISLIGAAGLPPLAHAQAPRKIPRVGVLWHAASAEEEAVYLGAVRRGLSDLGYVEGQTIILENRFPAEQPERFASMAVELAELKVDVLVAINRIAALAAQRATKTIPIVFVAIPDPVGSKLVASLARPGGNITGLSNMALDLTAKRLEFLTQTVAGLRRIGLLVNGNDRIGARQYVDECRRAAERLKIALEPLEILSPGDLAPAFSKMAGDAVDGLVVTQDGLFYATRKEIADLALAQRLPSIVYSRETLEAGALASYGPDNYGIFRRTGVYVDRILKGAAPADLAVEQPTQFQFMINLKTAKALDLAIPPGVIARADEVLE
jgi:putative tryptophan/tyrosine transport system substrate-binding protein